MNSWFIFICSYNDGLGETPGHVAARLICSCLWASRWEKSFRSQAGVLGGKCRQLRWGGRVVSIGCLRKGSMDMESGVHYPVVAPWKPISDGNQDVVISLCKDEIKCIIISGG